MADVMERRMNKRMSQDVDMSKSPYLDPEKAKEIQKGATESGWQPDKWKKNLKEGLGIS